MSSNETTTRIPPRCGCHGLDMIPLPPKPGVHQGGWVCVRSGASTIDLESEVRRLSGCLLVIAGAEGCGNGSLRTAAFEAATMRATVADLANKLGSPAPKEWSSSSD